jgi:riboflavin kinase/FMN adenylyltransferase
MQRFDSLQAASASQSWLTIGAFDGLHLGHQLILKELTAGAHAAGAPAVVLTFDPHPAEVLRGPRSNFYLSDPEEKAALLAAAGVDVLVTHPFDEVVRDTPAADFVTALKGRLDLRQLWVGADFALGRDRQGDVPALQQLGLKLNYSVHAVPQVRVDGEVVSSSRIRALLSEQGDAADAARLLGRNYTLAGTVVGGAKRGRTIGIPTANVKAPARRLVPATGVYATWATVGGQRYASVTNIGLRPTFEERTPEPVVEAHLFDYSGGEFYDQTVTLEFVARLRGEHKFDGVDALLKQIHADIQQAKDLLK